MSGDYGSAKESSSSESSAGGDCLNECTWFGVMPDQWFLEQGCLWDPPECGCNKPGRDPDYDGDIAFTNCYWNGPIWE